MPINIYSVKSQAPPIFLLIDTFQSTLKKFIEHGKSLSVVKLCMII